MLSLQTSLAFFSVSVLLALSPGPDNVFVLVHAAQHGVRAGLLVVLGLCSGLLFHTAAVALGLAALLAASPLAFGLLKGLGAVYLLWLAWLSWRAPTGLLEGQAAEGLSPAQTYARGIVMNATNPKVAIFFLAFLPQFVEPAQGPVQWQILQLGACFGLATLLVFGGIAALAGRFGQRLRESARAQQTLNRAAALVFAGLALRLVWLG
jgi:threonine/homoserine/homoserine lactone efflux protein